MKKLFLNQQGISLVQTMVAMGLAGGLAVFLMRLTGNMQKVQKYTEVKSNEIELFGRIGTYLRLQEPCNSAVMGFRPGETFDILQFNEFGGGTKLTVGDEIPGSGLSVERLEVLEDPTPLTNPASGTFEVTIRVQMKRKDGNYLMAGTTKNKDFLFAAELCEPTEFVYKNSIELTEAKSKCDKGKTGDVTHTYHEPKDLKDAPPSGSITCFFCGPKMAILNCKA